MPYRDADSALISVRKMRMQMQENSREKQAAQAEADDLRAELDQIRSEMTQVRRSVIVEKQSLEDKLSEERVAKERARAQLEERLNAAMQKKSKFQVRMASSPEAMPR